MRLNKLFELIESGKKGKNIGISTGSEKIDSVMYGIQKRYLYTIGADTSGFKNQYNCFYIEAPIIYDRKLFELLGTREDLITKSEEEILNANV